LVKSGGILVGGVLVVGVFWPVTDWLINILFLFYYKKWGCFGKKWGRFGSGVRFDMYSINLIKDTEDHVPSKQKQTTNKQKQNHLIGLLQNNQSNYKSK
jgi:hypothetical protein